MRAQHRRRLLRWALWLSVGLIAVIATALLAVPWLLDLPAVRARLERQLSEAAGGRLSWDTLDVRLLPTPRGVTRGARVEIPGVLSGRAEELEVHLRLLPLLAGRVEIQHVLAVRPVLRVTVAKAQAPWPAAPVDPIAVYRRALQPAVDAVRKFAPDLTLSVQDATLEVSVQGLPTLGQVRLTAEGRSNRHGMALAATANGILWESVKARAHLEYADLKAHVEVDAARLQPQVLLDHFLAGAAVGIAVPSGNARVELDTDGRSALSARLTTDIPALTVSHNHTRVELHAAHADATATAGSQQVEVTLNAVRLGEVVAGASGRLRFGTGAQGAAEASLEIPAMDLARLRAVAMTLARDRPLVQRYLARIRAGQVRDLRVSGQAEGLARLAHPQSLSASLKVARGVMLVPYVEQEVDEISGAIDWSKGVLKVTDASGRLGRTRVANGSFDYRSGERRMHIDTRYDVDLAQGLELARRLLPQAQRARLDRVRTARGKAQGRFAYTFTPNDWKLDVAVTRSDSLLTLRGLPWPASMREGQLTLAPRRMMVAGASGTVGASTFRGVGVQLDTGPSLRIDAARGTASLALAELHAWLRQQEAWRDRLRAIDSVAGELEVTVNRLAGRPGHLERLNYDLILNPRRIRAQVSDLPAPLGIDGGSVHVTPQALHFDGVVPALLDARARVNAVVRDYRTKAPQLDAQVADGETGAQFMTWAWARSQAPAHLRPKTPLRFAAERVRWSAKDGVDVRARAQVAEGANVDAEVAWKPDHLDVRSLRIQDQESNATLGVAMRGRLLDVSFAGVLTGRSVDGLFAQSLGERLGRLEGDFRAAVDRDLRGGSSAQGQLKAQQVHLERLLGRPLTLERIDLHADHDRLRISEASIEYADQKATMRGEIRRGPSGFVIDAQVETPGFILDTLQPPSRETVPESAARPVKMRPEALAIWPLVLEGKLSLRAGFLEYRGYRVEPVAATLVLEPERARLLLTQAMLCGIEFPLAVDITPQGASGSVRLLAKDKQLETTARCLTDHHVLLTGEFDLYADLRSRGSAMELWRNLEGTVKGQARDGKVMKFAMLGNILSLKSISSLLKRNAALREEGFDYRAITVRGRIAGGRFEVEEGAFDSPALGLAATGSIQLQDGNANLTVLVAPFTRVDQLSRRIPIIGYILGGALTSVAVGVNGDIRNPAVLPLDPRAVSAQLVGIFERTLKLPKRLLEPLQGTAKPAEAAR